MAEAEQECIACLTDHFSAWSEYVKYIQVYRTKEEAQRRARYEKQQAVDNKLHDYRVKETCLNLWKIWFQTNSTKARRQLAEVNEVETYVGGMRYMRVRGGKKTSSTSSVNTQRSNAKQARKKAATPDLAQIVQRPRTCEPDQLISIANLQDRTMVEYSMQKLRWAPKETPFMRGRPLYKAASFVPETSTITMAAQRRPPRKGWQVDNVQDRVEAAASTTAGSPTCNTKTVWGAHKTVEFSKGVYSASARPAPRKKKSRDKMKSQGKAKRVTDGTFCTDNAHTAQINQIEDHNEAQENVHSPISTKVSNETNFGIHSSKQFRPVPPLRRRRATAKRTVEFDRRERAKQNRRRFRKMQTKKLHRSAAASNPKTAAGLEAAAEAAAAQVDSQEFSDEGFFKATASSATVESKQVTLNFNAKLSLAY